MIRKLIIHIGCHKTGTSSIQHTLYKNKVPLFKQGFTLFHENPDGSERKSGNALTWVKFKLKREHRIEGKIRKELPKALAAAGNNVIISAETLSWVFSAKDIQGFQKQLSKYFDDIKIIAYIRRQDMQAVSQYQQASKHGAFVAARFYNGGTRALPVYKNYFQKYLNYHRRLGMWADAFGDNNMVIRVFERSQLIDGDSVADFFQVCGLTKTTASPRTNESSGWEKTKIGHLLSQQEFSEPVWRKLAKHLDNNGKLMPSREAASAFYANFIDSNNLLNKRFSLNEVEAVFNSGFDTYPIDANDQWTEHSTNAAIQNLLKGVKGLTTFEQGDMDFLRQYAQKLEKTDSDSSQRILNIVKKYSSESSFAKRVSNVATSRVRSYLRK